MKSTFSYVLLACLTGALNACATVGPDFTVPDAALEAAWIGTMPAEAATAPQDGAAWWSGFGDPVLTGLIGEAGRASPTLQMAALKINQSRAQLAGSTGNAYLQSGSVQAGASALHYPDIGPIPAGQRDAGFGKFTASWEFDFWGKYQRQIESDAAGLKSSEASYENAMVILAGQVATTYINMRIAERRLQIAQQNLESTRQMRALAQDAYRAGADSALDVSQADVQQAQAEAQLPGLEKSRAQQRNALALLIGVTPAALDARLPATAFIPTAPSGIAAGIPHDLLRRRPDVRQAAWDAAGKSAAIGVAQAALLPSFALTGSFSMSGSDTHGGSLFAWQGENLSQLQAGFTLPLFNRGKLHSQVHIADAAFGQAVLNYQNTVLTAQKDVEDALAATSSATQALAPLATAVQAGERAARLARDQYRAGAVSYQPVLDTERALLQDRDSLAQGQGTLALASVALFGALGGGWPSANAVALTQK